VKTILNISLVLLANLFAKYIEKLTKLQTFYQYINTFAKYIRNDKVNNI